MATTTATGHLQAWLCPESSIYCWLCMMSLRETGWAALMRSCVGSLGTRVQPPLTPPCSLIYNEHSLSFATWLACRGTSPSPKLFEALGGQGLWKTHGEQGSTHPPPVPLPFLLKCVRGSLEASFSSSVHSRSHSSSVYTSPDWHEGKLVQEAASVTCPHLLLPQRQRSQATQVGLSPVRTQTGYICECPDSHPCALSEIPAPDFRAGESSDHQGHSWVFVRMSEPG